MTAFSNREGFVESLERELVRGMEVHSPSPVKEGWVCRGEPALCRVWMMPHLHARRRYGSTEPSGGDGLRVSSSGVRMGVNS